MEHAHRLLDQTIRSVEQLRSVLAKKRAQRLVRGQDERSLIKATGITWFNTTRPSLLVLIPHLDSGGVDGRFRKLVEQADRDTLRASYLFDLPRLKAELVALRSTILSLPPPLPASSAVSPPPDFSPLVGDLKMQAILARRWKETSLCIGAGADLAATVMIGGLLEGLLLARLNLMRDKGPAFRAGTAPKDRSGATLQLKDWALKNYIDVGHELGWIGNTAKDVSVVVRDYRNYIHPAKELSHGLILNPRDTAMLWSVFVTIANEILQSTRPP